MRNTKDALGEEILITKIILNKDFRNVATRHAWKITALDGHYDVFRQTVSQNSQHMQMWQHCRCQIEELTETRELNTCNINGVQLKQIDQRTFEYTSKGKASAAYLFHNKLTPGLKEIGYLISKYKCESYVPKRVNNNCHDGTILDGKYSK